MQTRGWKSERTRSVDGLTIRPRVRAAMSMLSLSIWEIVGGDKRPAPRVFMVSEIARRYEI